jgi:hypothetical protein
MSDDLRLPRHDLRELRLDHLPDSAVQFLALPARKAAIRRILDQSVLENVRIARRDTSMEDERRANEVTSASRSW